MKLSVLLASLNGERFINFRLDQFNRIETGDELIISDDGSQDATVSIIEGLMTAGQN